MMAEHIHTLSTKCICFILESAAHFDHFQETTNGTDIRWEHVAHGPIGEVTYFLMYTHDTSSAL